ncbi:LTA synthase family protein [Bifidobacterium aquikefiri]|uniref:LTA synthase family protein n=1 Tax=Bifidobacterium aquikefiri TaxID=1653207 RepID=UPI0023F3CBD8|nr:alkaline phosphatase family protein [Bifidobacterium aquikefiri]
MPKFFEWGHAHTDNQANSDVSENSNAEHSNAEKTMKSKSMHASRKSASTEHAAAASQHSSTQPSKSDGQRPKISLGASRFSNWTYAILFLIIDIVGVAILQWAVTISSSRVALSSPLIGLWGFISTMWTDLRFVFVLNLIVLGLIYGILLFLTNRFWIASPIFIIICTVMGIIEHMKVISRYETVLPSDMDFLHSDAGTVATFLPAGSQWTILWAVIALLVLVALCIFINHMDLRRGRIFDGQRKALNASFRVAGILVTGLVFTLFSIAVGTVGTWANTTSKFMGDIPSMWDSVYDAQRNGTMVAFLRQLNPKVMDEPSGYSQATMKRIAKRYEAEASSINATRKNYENDSSVIYILSESFSDPTRVPGLSINQDPMPKIRAIKQKTTSGLMLSSGYGGGTANLEFQALTGLSMANFDSSLTSPYQQLVPSLSWTPSVNQNWSSKNAVAFHPYESSMYSRSTVYKKFGFSNFYTLEKPDIIKYQNKLDSSPYVSDESAYKSALEEMQATKSNQFVQIVTMQNHMPYNNWYTNNQFQVAASSGSQPLGSDEALAIDRYAKGMSYTDSSTQELLDSLNTLSKPVTVVFYGDHLPGIYTTAGADSSNAVALHETDYFIWSNRASKTYNNKIPNSSYTSPNFFSAQSAEYMNAKVSPYTAFLTAMHSKISAMEPPVVNQIQGWDRIPAGQTIYLDSSGNPMDARSFDAKTKQLIRDYKLIQYDITAGKHYLKDTDFMTTPTAKSDAAQAAAKKLAEEKSAAKKQANAATTPSASPSESKSTANTTSGK